MQWWGGKQKNPTLTKKKKKKKKKKCPIDISFPNFSFELILQSKGPLHRYPHPTVTRKKIKSQLIKIKK